MKDKPILVLLEGIDKVGKTTVYKAFRRMNNFGPLCIDRFLASNFAYDNTFLRKHYIRNYTKKEKQLLKTFDVVLVYLTTEWKALFVRLRQADDSRDFNFFSFTDIWFWVYFKNSKFRKIIIDTTRESQTPDKVAIIIENFIYSKQKKDETFSSSYWRADLEKRSKERGLDEYLNIKRGLEEII